MSQLPEPSAHDDLQNEFSAILEHAARLANGETAIADILQEDAAPRDSVSSGKPSRTRKKKATAGDAEAPTSKRVRRKRANDANGEQEDPDGEDAPKAKRKRRARRAPRDSEGEDEESPASTKRKRTSSRKSRSSSAAPVFDPNADPGEELDPTVVTMATLCEDTGQGRISSKAAQILDNHAAWKHSNRERRLRMKVLMEAKKYGRNDDDANNQSAISGPSENPDAAAGPSTSSSSAPLSSASTPAPPEVQSTSSEPAVDGSGSGFDYTQSMATSRFNVQIRIGPNGETIVDEESLYVDRAQDNDTENYTHVEESDATKFINSASYGKKYRGTRWSAEETELFYEAVSQFGENYELISYILPGRDRKACKAKFKNEDRKNPARITYCLDNRVPYDMKTLSRMTGKDFSGPTPVIRARTPLNLSEVTAEAEQSSPSAPRKQSRTPGLSEGDGADGAHDDMDTDLSSTHAAHDSGARATSVGSNKPPAKASGNSRKKGKNKKDDGVEVLGTIDDNQWDD
ncbi:hypothetical protein FA95DRAFT_1483632 [Auriscalpium vulgare]|uniref:Uncharacterized protein n=1 Tax=Auriscalpium vulgare TaxID=40419 RepID=A0ACB8S9I1_9AGAM|nr:hypothetical protein FA95DRAFT_1483632 [Auriscalpium vulgare]